jgi:hypothetical protein
MFFPLLPHSVRRGSRPVSQVAVVNQMANNWNASRISVAACPLSALASRRLLPSAAAQC